MVRKLKFSINGKTETVTVIKDSHLDFSTGGFENTLEITSAVVDSFSKEEIRVMLHHELFHKYWRNWNVLPAVIIFSVLLNLYGPVPGTIALFLLLCPVHEICCDVYAARKVGKKRYLQVLRKYSGSMSMGTISNVVRQLTHFPDPVRFFLISMLA